MLKPGECGTTSKILPPQYWPIGDKAKQHIFLKVWILGQRKGIGQMRDMIKMLDFWLRFVVIRKKRFDQSYKDCEKCQNDPYTNHWTWHINKPFEDARKLGKHTCYGEYSETIREVPQNYCLATLNNGKFYASVDKASHIDEKKLQLTIDRWKFLDPKSDGHSLATFINLMHF